MIQQGFVLEYSPGHNWTPTGGPGSHHFITRQDAETTAATLRTVGVRVNVKPANLDVLSSLTLKRGEHVGIYGMVQVKKSEENRDRAVAVKDAGLNSYMAVQYTKDYGMLQNDVIRVKSPLHLVDVLHTPLHQLRELVKTGGQTFTSLLDFHGPEQLLKAVGGKKDSNGCWEGMDKSLLGKIVPIIDEADIPTPFLPPASLVRGEKAWQAIIHNCYGSYHTTATQGNLIMSLGLNRIETIVPSYPNGDIYYGIKEANFHAINSRVGKFNPSHPDFAAFVKMEHGQGKLRTSTLVNAATHKEDHLSIMRALCSLWGSFPAHLVVGIMHGKSVQAFQIKSTGIQPVQLRDSEGVFRHNFSCFVMGKQFADVVAFYDACQRHNLNHTMVIGGNLLLRGGRFNRSDFSGPLTATFLPHNENIHLERAIQMHRACSRVAPGTPRPTNWEPELVYNEILDFVYHDGPTLMEGINRGEGDKLDQLTLKRRYSYDLTIPRKEAASKMHLPYVPGRQHEDDYEEL